jgi:hypothetical protein
MLLETDAMADELKDNRIPVMMGATEVAAIDEWRRRQPDLPSRSEAIRRLVELGLTIKARPTQITPPRAERAERAATTAGKQLDQLVDKSASVKEQAIRKRRLLKGPEEFQSVRIDRPAKKK